MEPALSYAEILEQQLEVNRHKERVFDLEAENENLKQQLAKLRTDGRRINHTADRRRGLVEP